MISRRDFLQVSMAASALVGASGFGNWGRLAAQQSLTQDQLLQFDTFGNISLIHITDIHAQLKPIYFREPSINLGVGGNKGHVPHITGADFRRAYGITDGSPSAYALTHDDFSSLAQGYGRVGGMDRVATVINAIRDDRPDALLLFEADEPNHVEPADESGLAAKVAALESHRSQFESTMFIAGDGKDRQREVDRFRAEVRARTTDSAGLLGEQFRLMATDR